MKSFSVELKRVKVRCERGESCILPSLGSKRVAEINSRRILRGCCHTQPSRMAIFLIVSVRSIHLALPYVYGLESSLWSNGILSSLPGNHHPPTSWIRFVSFYLPCPLLILLDLYCVWDRTGNNRLTGTMAVADLYSLVIGLADQRVLLHTINHMVLPAPTKFTTINALTSQDNRHCGHFLWRGGAGSKGYGCYDGIIH